MREHLFRGKSFNKATWEYGSLFLVKGRAFIGNDFGYCANAEVRPSTIGEYTGLDDKNGKKIFEGDYVENNGGLVEVKFNKGAFIVGGDGTPWTGTLLSHIHDVCEVKGNIYDVL